MKTYLIQRGTMGDNASRKGLDSIVSLDYMGAAEYEWGALPSSLKRLRDNINEYTYLDVPIFGKCISVFCKNEQKQEVLKYLTELAEGEMRIKMGSQFNDYMKPSNFEIEWQKKHPLSVNFWWDIENDLMFWEKNPEFEAKFKNVIGSEKLQLNIPAVIGSYIIDGVEQDYTKESLRGDIAILTMDMVRILLDYMKNNGYDDVYITPLITELTNKGLEFANNYR